MARLACDECGRISRLSLGGVRILAPTAGMARDWLRMHCGGQGWSLLASEQDGQAVTLDLCPKCTRKLKKVL